MPTSLPPLEESALSFTLPDDVDFVAAALAFASAAAVPVALLLLLLLLPMPPPPVAAPAAAAGFALSLDAGAVATAPQPATRDGPQAPTTAGGARRTVSPRVWQTWTTSST